MSWDMMLQQSQAFLKNHAKTIFFLSVYVQNNYILEFSVLEFMNIYGSQQCLFPWVKGPQSLHLCLLEHSLQSTYPFNAHVWRDVEGLL